MRQRHRTIAVIVGVAVGSLLLGFVLAGHIQSPREAAALANAPEASAVTVPVERRELASSVVTRGDAVFAGAVDVTVELSSLETPAVVTGHVPQVGDTIKEGKPLLEIVGRPVIALAGELPTYRTLRPGMSGPDVEQLEAALARLGLDPGDAEDGRYDAATAAAMQELYRRAGYEPPAAPEATQLELEAAQDAVAAAEDNARGARDALAALQADPPASERLAMDAQVAEAERTLELARQRAASHAQAVADAEADLEAARSRDDQAAAEEAEQRLAELREQDPEGEVIAAESQLAIARASLQEFLTPAGIGPAQAAVASAEQALTAAKQELDRLRFETGTPAPAAELAFVPTLPRRVDGVAVRRGGVVDGAVMTVSGADLVVVSSLSDNDRQLLSKGMPAELAVAGRTVEGKITSIRERDKGGFEAVIKPADLDRKVAAELRGTNLKVTMPIDATDGAVLVVPLAALTAGSDGGSRVEVQGGDGETELIDVEVGLAADGYAEVRPLDADLAEGDLVVVGQ